MATRNNFDAITATTSRLKTAKILNSHKRPAWALKAYIAFMWFMKNVQSISTYIHLYWSLLVLYLSNYSW